MSESELTIYFHSHLGVLVLDPDLQPQVSTLDSVFWRPATASTCRVRRSAIQTEMIPYYRHLRAKGLTSDHAARKESRVVEEYKAHKQSNSSIIPTPLQPDRGSVIREFCLARGIDTLVHFTRVENLGSILRHGLVPREDLEQRAASTGEQSVSFNDADRYDGCPNANCLSIAFPNYRMFYRYRNRYPRAVWTVLLLRPDILWEMNCVFCWSNAARSDIKQVPLSDARKPEALATMFADTHDKNGRVTERRSLNIPGNYTTDPQAEVLVFGNIPPTYVTAIHFRIEQHRSEWKPPLDIDLSIPVLADESLFKPRSDFEYQRNDHGGIPAARQNEHDLEF